MSRLLTLGAVAAAAVALASCQPAAEETETTRAAMADQAPLDDAIAAEDLPPDDAIPAEEEVPPEAEPSGHEDPVGPSMPADPDHPVGN